MRHLVLPSLLALGATLAACGAEPTASPAGPELGSTSLALIPSTLVLEATFTSVQNGWVKVERWKDNNSGFLGENYPPDGRGNQEGQRLTFFGNVLQPHSSRFLLYYAPAWSTGTQATPVLLVHGANDNADRAWANPNEMGSYGCGATSCPSTGTMQYLNSRGYKVFAINFPHKQGDNYYWAQQIHDAIEIIKTRTGSSKVDVVGWSKGAFSSRQYVSSVRKSWGNAYGGSVRRLLLLGNPNTGFDYIFRHGWSHDASIFTECGGTVNAPAPHSQMVCYGVWRNHPELSIFTTSSGNFYPGQKQMLGRFDGTYALPTAEQDWYTTYYGGQGYYTYGQGIQYAMDQGSLVQPILSAGIPSTVPTYLLCGGAATIPTIHNEHTGYSDGVVFYSSCGSSTGIGYLAQTALLSLDNHLQLGWESSAMAQVEAWLR